MSTVIAEGPKSQYESPIGHRLRAHLIGGGSPEDFLNSADFFPSAAMRSGLEAEASKVLLRYEAMRNVVQPGWKSYDITWTASGGTSPAIGNGTLLGWYLRSGGSCLVSIKLIGGTTTTWGSGLNTWVFSAPLVSNANGPDSIGSALANESGVGQHIGSLYLNNDTTALHPHFEADGGGAKWVYPTFPFTWGYLDVLWGTIQYPLPSRSYYAQ